MASVPKLKSEVVYRGPSKDPGDYFSKMMPIFKKEVMMRATAAVRQMADAIVAEAKEILGSQRYNWKPLNAAYRKWKGEHGLDQRILIATGLYRDSIKAWVYRGQLHIGVPRSYKYSNGVPLWLIVKVHEFGTRTIPARPLWRPLLSKYVRAFPKFRQEYYKATNKGLKEQFARKALGTNSRRKRSL